MEADEKKSEFLNFFSIFDDKIASKCLNGLKIVDGNIRQSDQQGLNDQMLVATKFLDDLVDITEKPASCLTCGIAQFTNRQQQVLHYKTDWHCHNLKRRLKDRPAVDRSVYEKRTKKNKGLSETSGSSTNDSTEDDDHQVESQSEPDNGNNLIVPISGRGSARVFFMNENGYLFSAHKCVLMSKQEMGSDCTVNLIERIEDMKACPKWAVILLGGGHFAAAIFKGQDVVIHKTLHRYVVRAKQGTSQGTHDRNRPAMSAGAALRRHNERALEEDVQSIFTGSWVDDLRDCALIFYRSAGYNRKVLFTGSGKQQAPFNKQDLRLRNIPFATKRATFREVVKVHRRLATVECHGLAVQWNAKVTQNEKSRSPKKISVTPVRTSKNISSAAKRDTNKGKNHQDTLLRSEHIEPSDDDEIIWETEELECDFTQLNTSEYSPRRKHRTRDAQKSKETNATYHTETSCHQRNNRDRLYTACKLGQLDVIQEVINVICNNSNVCNTFLNKAFGKMDTTYLHVVAQGGYSVAVSMLLENGADPANKDAMNRSPYALATDVETRKEFRRFRAKFPDKYDYKTANIPAPLSEDEERAKSYRQKLLRQQRRERAKELKNESRERDTFLNLSETEKKKASNIPASSRCFTCAESLLGKVPFEYEEYKFCKIPCLKEHRVKNKK